MTEQKVTAPVVPVIKSDDYAISAELWSALDSEVSSIITKLDNNIEMSPDDVAQTKALYKQVDDYLKEYNKQVTSMAKEYRASAKQRLAEMGFTRVEQYIESKRKEQTDLQNQRMLDKIQTFKDIVANVLATCPEVGDTAISESVVTLLMGRFPKINSGAVSKAISNWTPIESVVTANLTLLNALFTDFPQAKALPSSSHTMTAVSSYLRTGELTYLQSIHDALAKDEPYLKQLKLRQEISSKEIAVTMLQQAMSAGTPEEVLAQVNTIMSIANTL